MDSHSKKPDMAEEESAQDTATYLDSTVGSFENRLQKKLEEQEQQEQQEHNAAKERSARILQALNTIRKALQETRKIKLGKRFHFDLEISDWNGWPRLELNLIDSIAPELQEYGLIVTAHDRKQSGTVEFRSRTGVVYSELSLASDANLTRIPIVLKKSVRNYLDQVAEYVLNPKDEKELLGQSIKLQEQEEKEMSPEAKKLQASNLFAEDEQEYDRNQVAVESEETHSLEVCFDK